jgi:hypothetical protein
MPPLFVQSALQSRVAILRNPFSFGELPIVEIRTQIIQHPLNAALSSTTTTLTAFFSPIRNYACNVAARTPKKK